MFVKVYMTFLLTPGVKGLTNLISNEEVSYHSLVAYDQDSAIRSCIKALDVLFGSLVAFCSITEFNLYITQDNIKLNFPQYTIMI